MKTFLLITTAIVVLALNAIPATATTVWCSLDGQLTSGNDNWTGTINDDNCRGLGGNDIMEGKQGHDFLEGDSGADQLEGNAGSDVLKGGSGNDDLYGSDGNDELYDQDGVTNGFLKCGPGTDHAYADWDVSAGTQDYVDASCEFVHWNQI